MKCAYVLLSTCCLLSYGLAKPAAPLLNYQDSFGQYSFGYSSPDSARSEVRTLDGVTHGSYSYIDDTGAIQSAEYTADDHGFRITATNLPQGTAFVQSPLVYGADGKPVLNIQKLDQLVDKSDTNAFLKQAKQEATLEGKKQSEATATPDAGSTGSASTDPQTRIGDSNVLLQKEGSALVPEKEPSVGAVPNVGSIASIFSDATIGKNNVFLKEAKEELESASGDKTLTDGRIGNLEANVKSEPANAAPEAKPKLAVPNVASLAWISFDIKSDATIGENNVFLKEAKEERESASGDKTLTDGRIGNLEANVKSEPANAAPEAKPKLENSEGNLNVAAKKSEGALLQKDASLTNSSPALIGRIDAKEPSMPEKTQTRSQEEQQATIDASIIAPISLIPFDDVYPTIIRYGAHEYVIFRDP